MYRTLMFLLIVCLSTVALANDEAATRVRPVKDAVYTQYVAPTAPRVGGDTIETAVPIAALPFDDTGNTCNFLDNYDEACNFSGSTSPDVVYSYVAVGNEVLMMDLCHSDYDTKVYVYDVSMNVVGCNDDFYFSSTPECFTYSSYLEVELAAGETYYIVVDGYSGACGDYALSVSSEPFIPCTGVTCHDLAQPEGEGPLADEYVDIYNGGCNSDPEAFQTPNWIDWETNCMNLSGVSGWYGLAGNDNRDTDWFEIVALGDEVTVTFITDNETTPTRCMMTTANPSCAGYDYSFQTSVIEGCDEMTWTVPTTPGATYWVFVAPAEWISGVQEFNYCLEICGLVYDTVPNEDASWSEVKSLYR